MQKSTVTATDLREFYNADPKRLDRLSPEARKTVERTEKGLPKGRVHAEAVEDHNKRRKVQYVTGATKDARNASIAQAQALRVQAFEQNYAVGARGPLPKDFLSTLKG